MDQNVFGEQSQQDIAEATLLIEYLESRLDALVDESIFIAKRNGYAPYTTTIRAAWTKALSSVTDSLKGYFYQTNEEPIGPQALVSYRGDLRFFEMRKIARIHRSIGVTMTMYLGLLKHFRNLYIEQSAQSPGGVSQHLQRQIRDFFDEVELAVSADWQATQSDARIRELQESARSSALDKDRYFAIFESLKNPAFLLGKHYQLINPNQAAAQLYLEHSEPGEFVYIPSEKNLDILQFAVDEIMHAVHSNQQSAWLTTIQGRRCFDIRLRALEDSVENIPLGFVVLLNDITAHRQETEKAQQSERGMFRFLSTMSHEIRTPLHSVLGASELLRSSSGTNANYYLDLLNDAGQTLLETLNNVLDYSKLESGAPVPKPRVITIKEKLAEFRRSATLAPNRDRAELRFLIDNSVGEHVQIDWTLTQQILTNLVTNSLRADKEKRGVDISISYNEGSSPTIRFNVRDYGPGISEIDGGALFRPFDEVTARYTSGGGAGLGLAIAHSIVEAMQGSIGYDNLSDGALVWFEFPCQKVHAPMQPLQKGVAGQGGISLTDAKCLVIDDDPIGSLITASQLEKLQCHVDVASTIKEALKLCETEDFDVYIVDYILPDGIGPDLVATLRNGRDNQAIFIALTANIEALKTEGDTDDSFDLILAKPADLSMLSYILHPQDCPEKLLDSSVELPTTNLVGLAPSTIDAMVKSFEVSWAEFNLRVNQLTEEGYNAQQEDWPLLIHRLTGSSAILGIEELESQLRAVHTLLSENAAIQKRVAALKSLDVELSEFASWQELTMRVDNNDPS